MVINELYIKNFGKFSQKRMKLYDGINLIYGANEAGKTTLHMFIRGMMFGIEKKRGRASVNDIYSKYEPWEFSAYYSGSLRFTSKHKQFRIDRSFHRHDKSSELICESDGEELSIEHGDLTMILEGMNEVIFDNTVSIRQMKAETDKSLASELKNHTANYCETGDFELDIEKAIAGLKAQKKDWKHKLEEFKSSRNTRQEEIRVKADYIKEEIRTKRQKAESLDQELVSAQSIETRPDKGGNHIKTAAAITLIIGALLFFLMSSQLWMTVTGVGMGILSMVLLVLGRKQSEPQTVDTSGREIKWQSKLLKEECHEKEILLNNLHEQIEELHMETEEEVFAKEEIEALDLAEIKIRQAAVIMQESGGGELSKAASVILEKITAGIYKNIVIDDELVIRIHTTDRVLRPEQVSRGTLEQIYFALRMAASEVTFSEEHMPVILDDSFVMYDEERLVNTLRWLAESGRQVILMTCQKREKEILESQGMRYNEIII